MANSKQNIKQKNHSIIKEEDESEPDSPNGIDFEKMINRKMTYMKARKSKIFISNLKTNEKEKEITDLNKTDINLIKTQSEEINLNKEFDFDKEKKVQKNLINILNEERDNHIEKDEILLNHSKSKIKNNFQPYTK